MNFYVRSLPGSKRELERRAKIHGGTQCHPTVIQQFISFKHQDSEQHPVGELLLSQGGFHVNVPMLDRRSYSPTPSNSGCGLNPPSVKVCSLGTYLPSCVLDGPCYPLLDTNCT